MSQSPPELLQFLTRSDNRVTVLEALATGTVSTRSELQRETGISRSTLNRILGELEDQNLASKVGYRYEVTLFGGFLAGRLRSVFDSVETILQLQRLLKQLSDTNPDSTFTDHTSSEILTPTSSDPVAPARRFADLLRAASHVRLLVPAVIPALSDVDSANGDGTQLFEVVIPHVAFEGAWDNSVASRRLRVLMKSGDVSVFSYEGDIDYVVGTIDKTAVVGLTDDAGTIQGYIETSDNIDRSSTEAIVEAYQQHADRVEL